MSLFLSLIACTFFAPADHKPMPLWPGRAPLAVSDDPADVPMLIPYFPVKEKASGSAVVVCPGGGYGALAMGHEGTQIAQWLNERGIAAFILKYRLANKNRPGPLHPAPIYDLQRAIRMVRANAEKWNIDTRKIGVWGFSAGGHLASTAAFQFDAGPSQDPDSIDGLSCRPDFAILCYPVISMKPPYTHAGSRQNLLGTNADETMVESLCNDQRVTKNTSPTFLFHTDEDKAVPAMNSILFFEALKKHGVPAELHIYEKGQHGVGLALQAKDKALAGWSELLHAWLVRRDLCK
jgi:acetyl esterase/lipase